MTLILTFDKTVIREKIFMMVRQALLLCVLVAFAMFPSNVFASEKARPAAQAPLSHSRGIRTVALACPIVLTKPGIDNAISSVDDCPIHLSSLPLGTVPVQIANSSSFEGAFFGGPFPLIIVGVILGGVANVVAYRISLRRGRKS